MNKVQFAWAPDELRVLLLYKNGRLYIKCSKCGSDRQTAGKSAVLKAWKPGYENCRLCGNDAAIWFSKEEISSWPEGHKRCCECNAIKLFSEFHKQKSTLFGLNNKCKECRKPIAKEKWKLVSFEETLLKGARDRAKGKGREFDLTVDDIIIPETCPILDVPIVLERNSPYGPSIDRVDSNRGYTKDNILVMSKRGNTLKNNMTVEECEKLLQFLKNLL